MRRRTAANSARPRLGRPRRAEPLLERLEPRCLYTAALTGEVLVDPAAAGLQQTSLESQKAVAVDASGNSVMVWSGSGTGDASGIFARRYDASGNPLGGEFRVNTTTAGVQRSAAVAVDDAGDFVIVWASQGQDGAGYGVYAQRFNAAGVAAGAEFRVNATTAGDQFQPSVAMDQDGDFVVSWSSPGQDGSTGLGVIARRFNSAGVAQGGELVVNSQNIDFDQQYSRVAMDAGGGFVVTWQSYIAITSSTGVYARRYDASGTALSPFEFLVNTAIAGDQGFASIGMNASGAFVVAWTSVGQDGSSPASAGIYAQRYTAAGAAVGGEFHVSVTTAGDQQYPSVAVDDSGAFVITWQSAAQDGSGLGVYSREYTSAGVARAGESRLNVTTAGDQSLVSVAVNRSTGDYVAVWSGNGAGDADGVFARWFRPTAPGITVTPISGLFTTEAGGTATFSIVLSAAPTADVSIGLSSSDLTEGTISAAQLTFTAANWDTPQTVVVTGVNDAFDDGDIAYGIVTAAAVSTDANYNGTNASDVSVTNIDNDVAGITVNPTFGLVTTEAGGAASFTVVLTAAPTGSVTVGLSSSDTTEGTVSPGSVTFTSANWNVPQTVTVTGVNDAVHDGNIGYTIVTAAATSTDAAFNGLNAADVSVSNSDDDPGGVSVTPTSGLVTSEDGGAASFTVVLTVAPLANVTIGLATSNTAEGTVSASSLVFTPANWNIPQTVAVTGVDDAAFDGPIAYTIVTSAAASADAGYNGLSVPDVSVTNQDDDAGLRGRYYDTIDFSGPSLTRLDPVIDFNWGAGSPDPAIGPDTFSARWTGEVQPQFSQTYTFRTTSADGVRLWINGALVIDNWTDHATTTNTATISLVAGQWYSLRMDLYENTGAAVARLEWSSPSQPMQVVPQARLRPDNTAPVSADDSYAVGQGGVLASGAGAGVLSNDSDANWDPLAASLVSGPTHGSLTLNADGSFTYTPVPTFFGTDSFSYRADDGLASSGVATVTLTVSRTAGITVSPTAALTTTEAGGFASFSVALDGMPTAPVTIQLISSDASEGTLSGTVLTFDSSNWDVPQTVTVTGVDDHVADGDVSYTIALQVTSADARYDGMAVAPVGVTNREVPAPAPPPVPAPVPVQVPPVNPGNNNPPPAPPATDPEAPEKQDHQQPPVVVAEQHVGSITGSVGSAAEQSQPLVGTEDVRPGQPPEDLKPRGEGSVKSVPVMTVERPANQGPVEPLEMRVPDQNLVRRASVSLSMGLDAMARQIGSRGSNESASIRAVRHTFVAITVGYVVWSLRGASLIASLLTSMPLWRSLDPLPILENRVQPLTRKRRRWFRRRGGSASGSGGAEQPLGEMVN